MDEGSSSPQPLPAAAPRGEHPHGCRACNELELESYLFVTQIIDRTPSTLSSGIVNFTLLRTEDGYWVRNKDVVLDSIQSAPFHEVEAVADRQQRW